MKISQIISAFLFLDLFLLAATSNVRLFFHFPRLVAWMQKHAPNPANFMGIVLLILIKKGTNLFNLFFAVMSPITTSTVGKSYRNTVTGAPHLGNAARN